MRNNIAKRQKKCLFAYKVLCMSILVSIFAAVFGFSLPIYKITNYQIYTYMKRIIPLCLLCIAAICAKANITLHFNVDADNRAMAVYMNPNDNSYDTTFLISGSVNDVTAAKHTEYGYYNTLYLNTCNADAVIDSIKCIDAAPSIYVSSSGASIYLADSLDDKHFEVYTSSLSAKRTDSIIVAIVGNRAKVQMRRGSNGENVTIPTDTFALYFDPTLSPSEKVEIMAVFGMGALYSVELNNAAQSAQYGSWSVSGFTNGDTLRITTDSDVRIPVTFTLTDGTPAACIDSVTVNGKREDWTVSGFNVAYGAQVIAYFNVNQYKILVNGATTPLMNRYYQVASSATDEAGYQINVTASVWSTFDITLNTTHPSYVSVSYNGVNIPLSSTSNIISIQENNTSFYINANTNCSLSSVTDEKSQSYFVYNGSASITAHEGMILTVIADTIVRDQVLVIYIDSVNLAYSTYVQRGNYSSYLYNYGELKSGYNVANFCNADNDFYVYMYNSLNGGSWYATYLNDADLNLGYVNSKSFSFSNNDVLKIFLAGIPDSCNVTFTIDEDVLIEDVVRDIVKPVSDLSSFGVLQGTQIDFKAENAVVTVNDEVISPADGIYTVIAKGEELTINVSKKNGTAIQNAARERKNRNVYTLQGTLLLKEATPAQINALPAGLYIVNGKVSYLLRH